MKLIKNYNIIIPCVSRGARLGLGRDIECVCARVNGDVAQMVSAPAQHA